jgi:tetratricopeptide (TPR) repeat protein
MPIRFAIERHQWDDALTISAAPAAAPQFRAIAEWANSVAAAHLGKIPEAELHLHNLQGLFAEVRTAGDDYWNGQVQIQAAEAEGWLAHVRGDEQQAASSLRAAVDQQDRLAKRPITPGPVIPAREQLADLLLETKQFTEALREYELVLNHSPGRRNALVGAARAAELSGDPAKAQRFNLQFRALRSAN